VYVYMCVYVYVCMCICVYVYVCDEYVYSLVTRLVKNLLAMQKTPF